MANIHWMDEADIDDGMYAFGSTAGTFKDNPVHTNATSFLNFPLEKQNRYKARLKFEPITIEPLRDFEASEAVRQSEVGSLISSLLRLDLGGIGDAAGDLVDTGIGIAGEVGATAKNIFTNPQETLLLNKEQKESVKQAREARIIRSKKYCYLYMPVSLQYNDQVNIKSANLGVTGAATASAVRNTFGRNGAGGGTGAIVSNTLKAAGASLFEFGGSTDASALLASRLAQEFSSFIGGLGENISSGIQLAAQITANPVTRALFDNVPLRVFTFQFKFIPLSHRESLEIEKIIYYFRSEMYPEVKNFSATGLPYGYKFPNLFDIRVQYDKKNQENDPSNYRTLPNMEILPCYLINVQHNYNPSSMTWHKGGKPSEVDLSLTFTEYRPLSKGDIKRMGRKGDVGPFLEEDNIDLAGSTTNDRNTE